MLVDAWELRLRRDDVERADGILATAGAVMPFEIDTGIKQFLAGLIDLNGLERVMWKYVQGEITLAL